EHFRAMFDRNLSHNTPPAFGMMILILLVSTVANLINRFELVDVVESRLVLYFGHGPLGAARVAFRPAVQEPLRLGILRSALPDSLQGKERIHDFLYAEFIASGHPVVD